ncbi:putative cytochrome P450 monooxygenase [Aspergillus mulundensis]|uniref:Cytochrome P450 n=1 Tax=Aspergillus mulundensis TaxID=1810919 RepID=A0A3D8QAV1_9EURO|nr:hypothetical protein DSM5745_11179 [Aspergillus mulundensis]RDW58973.1 hypothetical protein DSM5745_11179 [Aspergillus mulundensis]
MVACTALVLALVVATLVYLLYNYSRLKSIPGPVLAAFTDIWRTIAQRSSPSEYGRFLLELHQKYGAVVRLGPAVVSLSNVEDIAKAYHTQLLDEASQLDLHGQPSEHREDQLEDVVDNALCNLVRTLRRYRVVNLTILRFFAEEIITELVGNSYLHPAASHTSSQSQPSPSLFGTMEEILLRGPVSLLKRDRLSCYGILGDVSASISATDPAQPRGFGTVHKFVDRMPLGCAFAMSIQDITDTFVLLFPLLLNSPGVLRKLRNEIENMPMFRNRAIIPSSRDVTGLFYLDAVFKEAMRLVLLQRQSREIRLSSGLRSNENLPHGTVFSWHPGVVLTMDSIFGDDAHMFRPERWLTSDRPRRVLMEEYLLPFTICRAYYPKLEDGWLQLKKTVVVLLREFDDVSCLHRSARDPGNNRDAHDEAY